MLYYFSIITSCQVEDLLLFGLIRITRRWWRYSPSIVVRYDSYHFTDTFTISLAEQHTVTLPDVFRMPNELEDDFCTLTSRDRLLEEEYTIWFSTNFKTLLTNTFSLMIKSSGSELNYRICKISYLQICLLKHKNFILNLLVDLFF